MPLFVKQAHNEVWPTMCAGVYSSSPRGTSKRENWERCVFAGHLHWSITKNINNRNISRMLLRHEEWANQAYDNKTV